MLSWNSKQKKYSDWKPMIVWRSTKNERQKLADLLTSLDDISPVTSRRQNLCLITLMWNFTVGSM